MGMDQVNPLLPNTRQLTAGLDSLGRNTSSNRNFLSAPSSLSATLKRNNLDIACELAAALSASKTEGL